MAELNYKDLGLERNTDKDIMEWNDNKIEILKYLPIQDKYDIVMITLQKSAEDGYYNPIKLDMYFHLNLIYMYTNLVFTQEERENEDIVYDELKSSGFLDEFLMKINGVEYKEMMENIEDIAKASINYNISTASVLNKFINDLPVNADAAQKIVDNFDPEKYQAVVDFAKAANGGRPIS
jgi:hypothetical protein